MRMNDGDRREGGVSEAIGFMLIFGLVVVGVGLVTLYGYPMLLQQQTSADERIMEKNMIVLQNDVKGLAYKMVPYKETALKIGGGTLTVYDYVSGTSSPTFGITDDMGTEYLGTSGFTSGDLRWESDIAHTDISLQNGAVVMRDRVQSGSTMLAEPRWYYDGQTNTVVINLIAMNSSYDMARSGIGTVQMELAEANYTRYDVIPGNKLHVTYTPPAGSPQDYGIAWDRYFVGTMKMADEGTIMTTRKYLLPTDQARPAVLVVKKYRILIKSL
jgi:hypothetical protein